MIELNGEQPLQPEVVEAVNKDEKVEEKPQLENETEQDILPTTDGSPIGKFKNVEALHEAYNSLQAEFTKKCQKLSEIQKEMESKSEQEEPVAPNIAYMSDDWENIVGDFLEKNPNAKKYASKISEQLTANPTLDLEKAYSIVLAKEYKEPSQLIEDEQFLNNFVFNSEKIKNKVLQDYFSSIKSNPIPPLMGKGNGAIASRRSDNVDNLVEAGKLAINLFK